MRLRHPYCRNIDCRICMADHEALGRVLTERTGVETIDHLGHYHRYLSEHHIEPETEYGWASPEAFDDTNINTYIAEYANNMSAHTAGTSRIDAEGGLSQ